MPSFRDHHLLTFFELYEKGSAPLDFALHQYFRAHKALGSKDRAFIAETVYGIVRWRDLIDALSDGSWEGRLKVWSEGFLSNIPVDLPPHIRVSFPKPLFDLLVETYGLDKATQISLSSNVPAPTTVRANRLKTTREALLELWKGRFEVVACQHALYGITFLKKINFFELPEFKQGLFEVQDEGSQLLAAMVDAKPGEAVLDYCAGSGGKTLAFAPGMQNRGQVYLHDIRSYSLLECRKRLKRAGIQNAQIALADDPKLKKLKKKMDWVLVDAPCSGTGTLRRNPDMKWKFSLEMLQRLIGQQRTIFERALSYVKPGGHIVYGTCSILKQENEEQMAHFLQIYSLQLIEKPFSSLPSEGGMDGFFGALFKVKEK